MVEVDITNIRKLLAIQQYDDALEAFGIELSTVVNSFSKALQPARPQQLPGQAQASALQDASILSSSLGSELAAVDARLKRIIQPGSSPIPTVLFVGDERVGKSFTLGSLIEVIVEGDLRNHPEQPSVHSLAASLGKWEVNSGPTSTGQEESPDQLLTFSTCTGDDSGNSGTATAPAQDLEAGRVGWTTTWTGRSCNVIPIIYTMSKAALADGQVKVVRHYQPADYVRKRLQMLQTGNDAGEEDEGDAEDPTSGIGEDALCEEVCSFAGVANTPDHVTIITQLGLHLPGSYEQLLGGSEVCRLGPREALRSGSAVRSMLNQCMAGRYGLYKMLEVIIPSHTDVRYVDTAGLASLASLGFERTLQILRDTSYSMVVLVQGDGKPSSDVMTSLSKAKVFAKFDSRRQSHQPPPKFVVVRNYGKDRPQGLERGKPDTALAKFKHLDQNADYHKAMETGASFLGLTQAVKKAVVGNTTTLCLFNRESDVPAALQGIAEIEDNSRLPALRRSIEEGLAAWAQEHTRMQLSTLLAKVAQPLLVLSTSVSSMGDVLGAEATAAAAREQLLGLASDELKKAVDNALQQAVEQSQSALDKAERDCKKQLAELVAKCTSQAACSRIKHKDAFEAYTKLKGKKLGVDLQTEDLTTTMLPEYLLKPLYEGAPAILRQHLEGVGLGQVAALLQAVRDCVQTCFPALQGEQFGMLMPFTLPFGTSLHNAMMAAEDSIDRCGVGTGKGGVLTQQLLKAVMHKQCAELYRLKTNKMRRERLEEMAPGFAGELMEKMLNCLFVKELPSMLERLAGDLRAGLEKAQSYARDASRQQDSSLAAALMDEHPFLRTTFGTTLQCAALLQAAKDGEESLLHLVAPTAMQTAEKLMSDMRGMGASLHQHLDQLKQGAEQVGTLQSAEASGSAAKRTGVRCVVCLCSASEDCPLVADEAWRAPAAGDEHRTASATDAAERTCLACYQQLHRLHCRGAMTLDAILAHRLARQQRVQVDDVLRARQAEPSCSTTTHSSLTAKRHLEEGDSSGKPKKKARAAGPRALPGHAGGARARKPPKGPPLSRSARPPGNAAAGKPPQGDATAAGAAGSGAGLGPSAQPANAPSWTKCFVSPDPAEQQGAPPPAKKQRVAGGPSSSEPCVINLTDIKDDDSDADSEDGTGDGREMDGEIKHEDESAGGSGGKEQDGAGPSSGKTEFLLMLPWLGPNRPTATSNDKFQAARKLASAAYRQEYRAAGKTSFDFVVEKRFPAEKQRKIEAGPVGMLKTKLFTAYHAEITQAAGDSYERGGKHIPATFKPLITSWKQARTELIDEAAVLWKLYVKGET